MVLGTTEDVPGLPAWVEVERDYVTDPRLEPAQRSDVWRYHVLRGGGFYADTDVLFLRSVEPLLTGDHDAWITQDGGTGYKGAGKAVERAPGGGKRFRQHGLSIGVLAAKRGSEFFCRAYELARHVSPSPDYQSHGTVLLAKHWDELRAGLSLGAIPFAEFYGGSSNADVEALWRPGQLPDRTGLHWYGGSPASTGAAATSLEGLAHSVIREALCQSTSSALS